MKSFLEDHTGESIITSLQSDQIPGIIKKWNKEVPVYVKNFNAFKEDRTAVIYLALFVEVQINEVIDTLFPNFNSLIGISKEVISKKINLLDSFKLYPKQLFIACRCINNIRNEFAHSLDIIEFEDLELNTKSSAHKKTVELLYSLTNEYECSYSGYIKSNDTLRNRFKTLCMSTIESFRIYYPELIRMRHEIEKFQKI